MRKTVLMLVLFLCILLAVIGCAKNGGSVTEISGSTSTEDSYDESEQEDAAENTVSALEQENTVTQSAEPKQSSSASAQTVTSSAVSQPITSTSTTSTPTETPKPAFNPQSYYDYALSYGKSVGLIFDPDMNINDNAWNAPLNLYASLTDENMKKGVHSSLNNLVREGFAYFGLYLEKQPDGTSYRLYFLYS
jgi:cytoskeletal protein RodZ